MGFLETGNRSSEAFPDPGAKPARAGSLQIQFVVENFPQQTRKVFGFATDVAFPARAEEGMPVKGLPKRPVSLPDLHEQFVVCLAEIERPGIEGGIVRRFLYAMANYLCLRATMALCQAVIHHRQELLRLEE